jgi:predicted metalloprotease
VQASSAKDGTVAVGRNLINQIRKNTTNFGPALTAVCAHEYGHILQFKHVMHQLKQLSDFSVRVELHADFVCGYFGAYRKREDHAYPAAIQAMTQFRYGDGEYKLINHGTRDQRGAAVNAGYLLGQSYAPTPPELAIKGLEYVTKLIL